MWYFCVNSNFELETCRLLLLLYNKRVAINFFFRLKVFTTTI